MPELANASLDALAAQPAGRSASSLASNALPAPPESRIGSAEQDGSDLLPVLQQLDEAAVRIACTHRQIGVHARMYKRTN
jgi:hypothetical protein